MNTVGDFGVHNTNWPACSNEVKRGRFITDYKLPLDDDSFDAERTSVARRLRRTVLFLSWRCRLC